MALNLKLFLALPKSSSHLQFSWLILLSVQPSAPIVSPKSHRYDHREAVLYAEPSPTSGTIPSSATIPPSGAMPPCGVMPPPLPEEYVRRKFGDETPCAVYHQVITRFYLVILFISIMWCTNKFSFIFSLKFSGTEHFNSLRFYY